MLRERAKKADEEKAAKAAAKLAEETARLTAIQEAANLAGEALLYENEKRNEVSPRCPVHVRGGAYPDGEVPEAA